MAGILIDRFGKDIPMIPKSDGSFTAHVNVAVSPQFLGWIISLAAISVSPGRNLSYKWCRRKQKDYWNNMKRVQIARNLAVKSSLLYFSFFFSDNEGKNLKHLSATEGMTYMNIGNAITEIRKTQGLTQEELEHCFMSPDRLYQTGKRKELSRLTRS